MNIFCIAARFVYPSVKRRLVEILYRNKKLTQKQIAKKLFVSQSAVSRYLLMERGSYLDIAICRDVDIEIEKLATILKNKTLTKKDLEKLLASIVLKALSSGCICMFHRQINPDIDPNKCGICPELFANYANWKLELSKSL